MIHKTLKIVASSALLLGVATINGWAPTNFFTPYDPNLKLAKAPGKKPFRIGVAFEYGDTKKGRNWDDKKVNILQINNATESSLAMLENPTTEINTAAFQLLRAQQHAMGAEDDGVRGHLRYTGDFDQFEATPHVRYQLPFKASIGVFGLAAYLPIRHANVDGIGHEDLTLNLAVPRQEDLWTRLNVTNDISTVVKTYGNLDLGNWSKTDLGDLVIVVDWAKDFKQDKEALQNVQLNALLGLSCPTGLEKDENKSFSLAFGNDGAWALPLGVGLDLDFKYHVSMGMAVQFDVIFDHSKVRRMKTYPLQTEFLLLNKGDAEKDYGLTWRFNLYLQGKHFWRGMSLKGAYEYTKHDSDTLTPRGNTFSSAIVNTANSLKEWNLHSAVFMLNYDFFKECKKCFVIPQLSLFYKLPCGGKKIINPHTFGGQLAVNF